MMSTRLGWLLFCGWSVLALVAATKRPGDLFELALIGVTGAVAWLFVRGQRFTLTEAALTTLAFTAPLLDTWPVRVYDAHRVGLGVVLSAFTALPSLLVLIAAFGYFRDYRHESRSSSKLLLATFGLLVIAVITSSAVASQPSSAFATGWISLIVPAAFGLLIAWTMRNSSDAWRYMTVAAISGAVPATIGIASYVLEFGFPTSGTDLVLGKASLFRPHLIQQATFGNVDHLADVALALVLPAAVVAVRQANALVVRLAGLAAALAALGAIVLTLSRSTLLIAAAAAAGLAGVVAIRRLRFPAVAPLVACALLIAVLATPVVWRSFSGLIPTQAGPAQSSSAQTGPVVVTDTSEQVRIGAARAGLRVFQHHAPFGVGSGEYPLYDPVHTAPHSLVLQLLAENGIFGVAALLTLAVFVVLNGIRLLRYRFTSEAYIVGIASTAAALALLLEGSAAGMVLAIGDVVVWPLLLFLLAACSTPSQAERMS